MLNVVFVYFISIFLAFLFRIQKPSYSLSSFFQLIISSLISFYQEHQLKLKAIMPLFCGKCKEKQLFFRPNDLIKLFHERQTSTTWHFQRLIWYALFISLNTAINTWTNTHTHRKTGVCVCKGLNIGKVANHFELVLIWLFDAIKTRTVQKYFSHFAGKFIVCVWLPSTLFCNRYTAVFVCVTNR